MTSYIYALSANFCFALGSMFFTHYSRKFSSTWMNCYKALFASILFGLTIICTSGFNDFEILSLVGLLCSGFMGLGIGDIFLLRAFSLMGPGRTMVLFGFHPLIVGILSFILLGQTIDLEKLYAIIFFVLCLITFSYEAFKSSGHWEFRGLVFALLGMSLDACGVIITRMSFDYSSDLTAFEGNFYRCLGALLAFIIISKVSPFGFVQNFKAMRLKSRFFVSFGALLGTYLSLAFYLEAIKTANLASISAIAITSVIFSSTFECIWEKKLPSKYLITAFIFFLIGIQFIIDFSSI